MKIKYSTPSYGEQVTIALKDGKHVIVKAYEVIELSDEEGQGLIILDAFTEVKEVAPTKNSSKEVKGE